MPRLIVAGAVFAAMHTLSVATAGAETSVTHRDAPSQELVAELLDWIGSCTDWMVGEPPNIVVVPETELGRMLLGERPGKGGGLTIRAVYDASGPTIYLPKGWDASGTVDRSALLHELVHHLQHVNRAPFRCRNALEAEAFSLQFAWLKEQGIPDPYAALGTTELTIRLLSICPDQLD